MNPVLVAFLIKSKNVSSVVSKRYVPTLTLHFNPTNMHMKDSQIQQLGRIIKNLRDSQDNREIALFRRKAQIAKDNGITIISN